MITLNRKNLIRNLELLKKTSNLKYLSVSDAEGTINAIFDGQFHLMANCKESSFVCITLEGDHKSDPFNVVVDLRIISLLKVAPDEQVTLSFGKTLVMKGESGYKSSLSLMGEGVRYYDVLREKMQFESNRTAVLDVDPLVNLCKVSKEMPVDRGRWVEIVFENGFAFGRTQETELGSLEALPITGEIPESISGLKVVYLPHLLEDQLRYCDKRVKLVFSDSDVPALVISDPDNPVWWGCLSQFKRN